MYQYKPPTMKLDACFFDSILLFAVLLSRGGGRLSLLVGSDADHHVLDGSVDVGEVREDGLEFGDVELRKGATDGEDALDLLISGELPFLGGVNVLLVEEHDLVVVDDARIRKVESSSHILFAHGDDERPQIVHDGDGSGDSHDLLEVDQLSVETASSRKRGGGVVGSQVKAVGVALQQRLNHQTSMHVEGLLVVGLLRFLLRWAGASVRQIGKSKGGSFDEPIPLV